jgi:hypothetical protein
MYKVTLHDEKRNSEIIAFNQYKTWRSVRKAFDATVAKSDGQHYTLTVNKGTNWLITKIWDGKYKVVS